jgi:uncharacterized damage-inducible protein DinB
MTDDAQPVGQPDLEPAMQDPRPDTAAVDGEAATLLAFLDYQRMTLEWKCSGLDDGQLARRLPTSALSLGGMLRHLSRVEDYWFGEVAARAADSLAPWSWMEWAAEWDDAASIPAAELLRTWDERVTSSKAVIDARLAEGAGALDERYSAWDGNGTVTLRWILVHMIEEYARHNGHADLLREAVDGQIGE